jgi:hypothetical protein
MNNKYKTTTLGTIIQNMSFCTCRNVKSKLVNLSLGFSLLCTIILTGCFQQTTPSIKKTLTLFATNRFQRIDGFGVNISPAQWNEGKLKPAIDKLVNDLGARLFRFDCTGLANWLDPIRRNPDGTYPQSYLDSVYRSKVFLDAWETFRYLNDKGIEPLFSISGRIPPKLGKTDDSQRLSDFDGYAEMIATMLYHARENQKLKFSLLSPFNETDLGYPEGPKIDAADIVMATKAIIKKLNAYGLKDVKLIVPDDTNPKPERLEAFLSDTTMVNRIAVFGTHTYGNGDIGDSENWFANETENGKFVKQIRKSKYTNSSAWMTEYGDLDQTNEIEFEFAWRSTRRLLKCLRDGFSAGIAWDAFDNFHNHDTAWAEYGLLKTDTVKWTYMPKKRFYAAKQLFQFIKPGWYLAELRTPQSSGYDVYKPWHDPTRNFMTLAFVSGNGKDFTIVGMNNTESNVEITIYLPDLHISGYNQKVLYYRTNQNDDCTKVTTYDPDDKIVSFVPAKTIFTFTTINQTWRLSNWFSK